MLMVLVNGTRALGVAGGPITAQIQRLVFCHFLPPYLSAVPSSLSQLEFFFFVLCVTQILINPCWKFGVLYSGSIIWWVCYPCIKKSIQGYFYRATFTSVANSSVAICNFCSFQSLLLMSRNQGHLLFALREGPASWWFLMVLTFVSVHWLTILL